MTTLTVIEAERDFKGTLRRVTSGHEVIVLKRGKREVAVMMPMSVMEDLEDIRDADAAYAAHIKDPSKAITLDEYERRRGVRECATR